MKALKRSAAHTLRLAALCTFCEIVKLRLGILDPLGIHALQLGSCLGHQAVKDFLTGLGGLSISGELIQGLVLLRREALGSLVAHTVNDGLHGGILSDGSSRGNAENTLDLAAELTVCSGGLLASLPGSRHC